MNTKDIYSAVDRHYADAARSNDREYSTRVAKQFGYSAGELESIPQDANLGLSCGNPHALANLKEGETVVDLGSGAGFDVFLAARKLGATGRAIGIDMNKEMLSKARSIQEQSNVNNVSFVESTITTISLPDETADCVISNCVINLVPEKEKQLVFNECFRILKSGGRFAVSDILAKTEIPPNVKQDMALYVGCIAGASQVRAYEGYLRKAGFEDILIVDTNADLNVYEPTASERGGSLCSPAGSGCCPPSTNGNYAGNKSRVDVSQGDEAKTTDFNDFAGSFKIFAVKA